MDPTYHYVACGLAIASDIAVPGLSSAVHAGPPDLRVSVGHQAAARATLGEERIRYISPEQLPDGTPQLTVWTGSWGAHRLRYSDGTEFIVDRQATRVDVEWPDPMTPADAATYFLGPVLGLVMRLRGIVPLHASAVMIGNRAVAFAGDAWTGKSTTAAAFAALGYPVLSDDLLPVVETAETILACPSHPRLTLWPDSARALFASDELPSLTPTYDKRYLDLEAGNRFHHTPVQLEVIYLLGDRTGTVQPVHIEPMRPQAALMALVGHTYGNYLLDGPMRAREFEMLGRVVCKVPVRRVTLVDGIERLVDSCRTLAEVHEKTLEESQ
jgi:hypothetical protein